MNKIHLTSQANLLSVLPERKVRSEQFGENLIFLLTVPIHWRSNIVIHRVKTLYYVLVIVLSFDYFWTFVNFCTDWYNNNKVLIVELKKHSIKLALATFGGVTIFVIMGSSRNALANLAGVWNTRKTGNEKVGQNKKVQ